MLRDSRSYEAQIIDAVRSVNKALGGTYGTSSAIHKNEFNQYEVQLIDAIKGIGKTLSGHGLSLVGGGVGEVTALQFQELSQRVSKLESESFFRLVNGNVTLKAEYQNLWVPGWLAAGGIGNGSSGGATHLYELEDVYHGTETVLRADGTTPAQPGDSLVYDSTHGWLAAPGGGSVTVVDNLTSSSATSALSANQGRTLKSFIDAGYVFKGFLHPQDDGTAVCDYPVCYLSGLSGIYLGYGNLDVSLDPGELALIYRAKNSSTWNYKTTTISGSGGGGSYSAGTGINISNNVISLKTASTSQLGGVKVDGTTVTINNGVISAVGGGGGGSGTVTSVGMSVPGGMSVTPSVVTTSGTFAVTWDSQTKNKVLASPASASGTPSFRALVAADIPDLSGKYVTLDTTQNNISGAKTFTTNPVTIASSSGIKVHASSYIDIGGARLVYDPGSNSLRVTKSSGSSTVNFYADGAVSAGAAGASSSSDIVFTDGDQTISGDKTFDELLQVDGNLVVNNTSSFNDDVTIGSATMSWASSRLNINKDTRFQYASGQYISISEIVSRLVSLGG